MDPLSGPVVMTLSRTSALGVDTTGRDRHKSTQSSPSRRAIRGYFGATHCLVIISGLVVLVYNHWLVMGSSWFYFIANSPLLLEYLL